MQALEKIKVHQGDAKAQQQQDDPQHPEQVAATKSVARGTKEHGKSAPNSAESVIDSSPKLLQEALGNSTDAMTSPEPPPPLNANASCPNPTTSCTVVLANYSGTTGASPPLVMEFANGSVTMQNSTQLMQVQVLLDVPTNPQTDGYVDEPDDLQQDVDGLSIPIVV